MAKIPTAQGVSAALRKDGFEKSETRTTRIKGWHEHTQGYRVRSWGEGEVRVEYELGFGRNDWWRVEKLAVYAETLRAKGWNVQQLPTTVPCLLVTELGD
jgi:hypothetical protein